MRYLTLAADYTQSCLKNDFEGYIEPETINLPPSLCANLRSWNQAYKHIIPLDMKQRCENKNYKTIERLDVQGKTLAEEIKQAINDSVKIRYFSEGLLRYLDI